MELPAVFFTRKVKLQSERITVEIILALLFLAEREIHTQTSGI